MKLIGQNYVSLVHKGNILRIDSTDLRYKAAQKLLAADKLDEYITLFNTNPIVKAVEKVTDKVEFRVENGNVFFGEFEVKGPLARKIEAILIDELDVKPFARFIEKLLQNPSARAVHELYAFLGYKDLAITDSGNFLGYKGIQSDWYSLHGNTETIVLKGTVNHKGQILNSIGEEIEVQRNNVDDDKDVHCSTGLHVGSIDYARGFGARTVIVEVDPRDVVTVPSDCNFQKLRVCRYKVVAEFEKEIKAPVANVVEQKVVEKETTVKKAAKATIDEICLVSQALGRKAAEEYEWVSVQSISNSFSPRYIKRHIVEKIAKDLGYKVEDGWIYL